MPFLATDARRRAVGILLTLAFVAIHIVWIPLHVVGDHQAATRAADRSGIARPGVPAPGAASLSLAASVDAHGALRSRSLHCHSSLGHEDDPGHSHPSIDHEQELDIRRAGVGCDLPLALLDAPIHLPEPDHGYLRGKQRFDRPPRARPALARRARGPPRA